MTTTKDLSAPYPHTRPSGSPLAAEKHCEASCLGPTA